MTCGTLATNFCTACAIMFQSPFVRVAATESHLHCEGPRNAAVYSTACPKIRKWLGAYGAAKVVDED